MTKPLSFLVPPHCPVFIPEEGVWRCTRQPSGSMLVERMGDAEAEQPPNGTPDPVSVTQET